MNKGKFIENIWITFSYNSMFCIGKTIISEGMKMVASVTDSADLKYILFEKVDNVKQLKLLKDVKHTEFKNNKRNIDFDTNSN
jgi:hypothetical protein